MPHTTTDYSLHEYSLYLLIVVNENVLAMAVQGEVLPAPTAAAEYHKIEAI